MERPPEPPWTEHEKVCLLAEIVKAAPVPSDFLMRIVRDWQISPKWHEICPPFGRSISSCQMAFQGLSEGRPAALYQSPATFASPATPALQSRIPTSDIPKKRPLAPETSALNTMGRIIQPRPPQSTYSHEPMRAASPFSTSPRLHVGGAMGAGAGLEPAQKKKRGRPTKAEAQARAEAAAARGDPYPLPRAPRSDPRHSNPQADSPAALTQSSPRSRNAPAGHISQQGGRPSIARPGVASEPELEGSPSKERTFSSKPGTAEHLSIGGAAEIGAIVTPVERSPVKSGPEISDSSRSGTAAGHTQLSPPLSSGPPSHTLHGRPGTGSAQAAEESEQAYRRREGYDNRQQQQPQQQPSQQQQQQQASSQQQRTTPHSFKETVGM